MAKISGTRKSPKGPAPPERQGKPAASGPLPADGGKRRPVPSVVGKAPTAGLQPPHDAPFPVAGVGASAGGLEAFTTLLRALPADTGIALVLVQHLDPNHESILPKLLSKTTTMPVHEVTDGMATQPNHVYVIPANRRMIISKGVLTLTSREPGGVRNLPIDDFFCALAADLKSRAIGIVLSGLASDGTQGLEAIKAEGGITFAQDEKSARYSSMPASAVAAGCVDFVMPPEKIAAELTRLSRHPYPRLLREPGEPPPASGDNDADGDSGGDEGIRRICAALRAATGVDFELYKPATIQRRVARRLVLKKVDSVDNYVRLLQQDRAELDALYEDIFIHVTSFFRDPEALQALRHTAITTMLSNRSPGQAIRVWVPGCSSGEEAYSIAMILQEELAENTDRPGVQVFGTDISDRSVERARAGVYPESVLAEVSAARLARFFVRVEGGYQIAKPIRETCVFARHDLSKDPPFSRLDLISCRNVLIYMGPVLQKRLLATFHYALKPAGHLFLGKSESPGGHTNLFSVEDRKNKIYARKPVATLPQPAASAVSATPYAQAAQTHLAGPAPRRAFDLRREAEQILLEQYAPAALVVDPDLYIVHFHGDTGPYLAPAAGEASFHLLRMVRPELVVDLRTAIHQAKKEGAAVRRQGVPFKYNGAPRTVDLAVTPVAGDPRMEGRHPRESDLLVVFQAGQAPAPAVLPPGAGPELKGRAAGEIARLERELAATREQIRALVEDYEAAREEMAAVNEETLSSSEELQSANEELETAQEEVQSSNEELTTLNDELQSRNGELSQLTNDLGNLLFGVDIPIVILDADQRIRRYTPPAEQVFSLIPTDVGRPFTDIASRLDVANWHELFAEVMGQQHVVERETRDRQGHWYNLRMRPFTAGDRKAEGILMALLDIDSVKRSLDEAREARDFAEAIVETVREPLVVLNADFQVLKATPSFYETFLVTHAETEGRSLFELGNGQWNIPRLHLLMEEMLLRGSRFENFEVAHEFPALGYRNVALNARQVHGESKGTKTILLAIEDITERVRAEERLRIRELIVPDAASHAVLSVDSDGKIVMANRRAETMFGYSLEELLELPLDALAPERFRQDHAAHRARYFAAPKLLPIGRGLELTARRKDGTEFPVTVGLSHTHTKAGMLAVAFITDVTVQRQAEEALRESEERFSLFMLHLPAAAFMKDLEGRYVYVNPGFGKLTSLPPGRCIGASDPDFWPASAELMRAQDRRVIQTGRAITTEDLRMAGGKPRHFQTVGFPIPNQHGQAALLAGITVEITDRKVAEQERQALLARLATAQEEERRRISRELHDDLTQRLASLAMDLGSLVAERPASAALLRKSLRSLQRRVVQAAEVTRHIAHELHPSELDDLGLVAALRSFSEDFARREGIEVGFASHNVPKELKREIGSCLYKVTQESLQNIAKHAGAKLISVTLDGTADRIRLRVKDAGIGFRAESPATKVGLGILSMKERVELLHGTFGIMSQPGRGTEVTVEVPVEVPQEAH
ncbi:MAG TPA: chemotaxis protein CheB [Candidatus Acidoferrales bacterium]|jgi:two-component system CheB/CheR fusion protein|nr:chemotaxis protein CheB [Candidatus Acidoferrales bacterium]